MTLNAIKREINLRLREVKADSVDFSGTKSYDTLQTLLAKAIERAAKCNSADELESIDNLLGVIEECYNDCKAEKDGSPSDISLFDFQFELDADESVSIEEDADASDDDKIEEKEEEITKDVIDISKEIKEIESEYEKLYDECNFIDRIRLGSLRRKAISAVRSANSNAAVVSEVYKYRRKFKRFTNHLEKVKRYNAAKPVYDELHIVGNLKNTNIARAVFGVIAVVGGAAYGLFEARWWPWKSIAYAITGIGLSCLLISLIYAIVIANSQNQRAVRRLCFMRIVLAAIVAVICLPLGIVFESIGIGTFYIATLPFTLCGTVIYLIYRIQLAILVKKKKK